MPKKPFQMSDVQRKMFFGLAARAAENVGGDRDRYRKCVLREELGVESSKDIRSQREFDAVIRRFAADAGDWSRAAEAGLGDVKRLAFMIRVAAMQIIQLKASAEEGAAAYLEGVLKQAQIPCGGFGDGFYLDVAPGALRLVLGILDTHRRKLLHLYNGGGDYRLDPAVRYQVTGGKFSIQPVEPGYYAGQPFTVNVRVV